jgi:hypothetical protein
VQEDTWWSPLPQKQVGKETGQGGTVPNAKATENRFAMVSDLTMGNASESDLNQAIGLDDPAVLARCIAEPLTEMLREWRENGSDTDWVNFKYVCHHRRRV